MKTIKIYLVFKDNPTLDTTEVYYVGKSKKAAKKTFVDKAMYFFSKAYADDVKIRFLRVALSPFDYAFLAQNRNNQYCQTEITYTVNNIWYGTEWDEIGMINNKTFELDFRPFYYRKAGQIPEGFSLCSESDDKVNYWLKKYLKRNF